MNAVLSLAIVQLFIVSRKLVFRKLPQPPRPLACACSLACAWYRSASSRAFCRIDRKTASCLETEVSTEQVQQFAALFPANVRPIQPSSDRVIKQSL
ncbi:hypothetical protein [Leptolyngbya sp. FACHB-711]|uniref:hypothetical protein n=1 Tax=unclassified Leptolyngbya TaxID=2650499 RepID=UPI001689573E|nr:hypothetical protein [Leptolyngbya sp. FACHB-711]MBD2024061.1 hypothetical protein [Leptolyngbya sp. FACHB-711]